MGNKNNKNRAMKNNSSNPQKGISDKAKVLYICLSLVVIFGIAALIYSRQGSTEAASGQGIEITKSDVISSGAKFYPYKIGNEKLEVVAVKASDGTVRTAFNTCQVCFSSGRGYYKVEGNELVCQNCGNRFKFDQVEKIRGGCNPVPIVEEDKTDDGTTIKIPDAYIKQNADLFKTWKL